MTQHLHIPRLVAVSLLLLVAFTVQAEDYKIAVVNIEAVIANSQPGKDLQEKLQEFRNQARSEVKVRVDKATELQQQAQDGAASLSAQKAADLKRQYEDEAVAIKRLQQDKQAEGQTLQANGLKEIEKLLGPIFEQLREEGGYDLILDSSGSVSSIIMYSEKVDISKLVLDRLNAAK